MEHVGMQRVDFVLLEFAIRLRKGAKRTLPFFVAIKTDHRHPAAHSLLQAEMQIRRVRQ